MIINIPTVIEELKENATEEQRRGLNILERRFYECLTLGKELNIATKTLKEISVSLWDEIECRDCAQKALKEMEEQ